MKKSYIVYVKYVDRAMTHVMDVCHSIGIVKWAYDYLHICTIVD